MSFFFFLFEIDATRFFYKSIKFNHGTKERVCRFGVYDASEVLTKPVVVQNAFRFVFRAPLHFS